MKSPYSLKRTLPALAILASCAIIGSAHAAEAAPKGDVQAAKSKVSMCIGCHGIEGYKSSFPEVYNVPMIAGQNAEYIVAALKEYATGARSFPTMEAIAQSLSEQDMADVAAYYASFANK